MTKYILIIIFIFIPKKIFSQEINGVYKSNFTSFVSNEDSSKNFGKSVEDIIVIDIYDSPFPRGYVSVSGKSTDGETVTFKFVIKSEKKYHYDDGDTYIYYEGVISLLEVETKNQCTIAIDVKLNTLFIIFENGSTQIWNLDKI